MWTAYCRWLALVVALLASSFNSEPFGQSAQDQSQTQLKLELDWSPAGEEILTPRFSDDGTLITLVMRAYWPDGADAEGLPDAFLEKLQEQAKGNPRFDDPVVRVIDLKGNVVCEVRYGWSPSLSSDNTHVVFAEQVKPITGFRELASPQNGNGIREFDCATNALTKIAEPDSGYLDHPLFSPDGHAIVYTEEGVVNGSFGGSIGIAGFDVLQKRQVELVKKQFVPAVPCPTQGPSPGLCAQIKELTKSFPQIVFQTSAAGGSVLALLGTPIPAPGDMYMAHKYDMNLVSVFPEQKRIFALGTRSADAEDDTGFQPVLDQEVLLFSGYWRPFSVTTTQPLKNVGPMNSNLKSVYSPNLEFYICVESSRRQGDRFVLVRTADGKRLRVFPRVAEAYGAFWDRSSKRFGILDLPFSGASPMHHREELSVYSVN